MSWKQFIFILLFFPISTSVADEMSAEDAIRIGLKNNYDILIAKNSAEIAEKNMGLGTAEFLPTLDALGIYQYSESEQETNSAIGLGDSDSRTLNGQISMNWTLFDGFNMFVNNARYKELAKLGSAQSRNIIENSVVGILRAYFNLVQQEQLLSIAKNSESISEVRLNKEQVRHDLGGASSTDLLNAQVSYNNDRATVLNQELQLLIARKELNIQLGRDADAPLSVANEIKLNVLDQDKDELIRLAEERNSYLKFAYYDRNVAAQNVKSSRSLFYPRLSLSASYGYTDSETNRAETSGESFFPPKIESQNKDLTVGLTASFNLFNGFRNKINLQTARLELENKELALEYARKELAGFIEEKVGTLGKQLKLIDLEQQNVIAAKQNLELQQDRYRIGASSSLEFRDAQVNLILAQTSLIVSRYLARITQLEIEQLVGNITIN